MTASTTNAMPPEQETVINQLREAGYAVVVFAPEALGKAHSSVMEGHLYEEGESLLERINEARDGQLREYQVTFTEADGTASVDTFQAACADDAEQMCLGRYSGCQIADVSRQ